MKHFLLSGHGARHEDRIPEAIFTSVQKARDYLTNYAIGYWTNATTAADVVVSEQPPYHGDYGDCIEFYLHHKDDVDCEDGVGFLLDSFDTDPAGPSFWRKKNTSNSP